MRRPSLKGWKTKLGAVLRRPGFVQRLSDIHGDGPNLQGALRRHAAAVGGLPSVAHRALDERQLDHPFDPVVFSSPIRRAPRHRPSFLAPTLSGDGVHFDPFIHSHVSSAASSSRSGKNQARGAATRVRTEELQTSSGRRRLTLFEPTPLPH